jgi:hypothetical protein
VQDAGEGGAGAREFGGETEHLAPELGAHKHGHEDDEKLRLVGLAMDDIAIIVDDNPITQVTLDYTQERTGA